MYTVFQLKCRIPLLTNVLYDWFKLPNNVISVPVVTPTVLETPLSCSVE